MHIGTGIQYGIRYKCKFGIGIWYRIRLQLNYIETRLLIHMCICGPVERNISIKYFYKCKFGIGIWYRIRLQLNYIETRLLIHMCICGPVERNISIKYFLLTWNMCLRADTATKSDGEVSSICSYNHFL